MMDEFDPALLRSFLAVADTRSFTLAARRQGLGQPAISQHVRRLEGVVGRTLLQRSTRSVTLTADGSAMAILARDILSAHQRAEGFFTPGRLSGTVRLGVTEDLTLTRLPEMLRQFRAAHPGVEMRLVVGLSAALINRLNGGELDLVFNKRLDPAAPGIVIWSERLVWLAGPDFCCEPHAPVPLVSYGEHAVTHQAAIAALGRQDRPWQQTMVGDSLSAVLAGIRAGFGVSAQMGLLAREGLVIVDRQAGLPDLPSVDFVLLRRPGLALTEPAARLADTISAQGQLTGNS